MCLRAVFLEEDVLFSCILSTLKCPVVSMVDTQIIRGRGRPRGRGRGRIPETETETETDVEVEIPGQHEGEADRQQQGSAIERALLALLERERSAGVTDWVKRLSQSSPPIFEARPGEDIEQFFRGLEGVFSLIGVPDAERQRLAAGQLRGDAYDRWLVYCDGRTAWTYEEFRKLMLREYCPSGTQAAREVAFFSTRYDPRLSISEIVCQFKKELVYCGKVCNTDEMRIRMLSMRLPPDVLLISTSMEGMTYDRFLEMILRYDQQLRLTAATSSAFRTPSGGKRPRPTEHRFDRGPGKGLARGGSTSGTTWAIPAVPVSSYREARVRAIICHSCHEEGHYQTDCPRKFISCYTCGGVGHRAIMCPQGERSSVTPAASALRLPDAPRPAQISYAQGQGRGTP
jgi:hypothetical protein